MPGYRPGIGDPEHWDEGTGGPWFGVSRTGTALLTVLVMLFGIEASSVSFIWFMNQQQARAGALYGWEELPR